MFVNGTIHTSEEVTRHAPHITQTLVSTIFCTIAHLLPLKRREGLRVMQDLRDRRMYLASLLYAMGLKQRSLNIQGIVKELFTQSDLKELGEDMKGVHSAGAISLR